MLRFRVAEVFLKSGTPFERLEFFRPLLERTDTTLTEATHLKRYIPLIEKAEFGRSKEELGSEYISVFFDGQLASEKRSTSSRGGWAQTSLSRTACSALSPRNST